jgi:hypothetical protein
MSVHVVQFYDFNIQNPFTQKLFVLLGKRGMPNAVGDLLRIVYWIIHFDRWNYIYSAEFRVDQVSLVSVSENSFKHLYKAHLLRNSV